MHDPYPSRSSSQSRLLPRVDPVFHGSWSQAAPLTLDQTRQFEEQGFLVLENLFTKNEIAPLLKEMQSLISEPSHLDPETLVTEPESNELRSIFKIHDQSTSIARLVADRRMAGIASYLLDDDVYIHQSRLNYKPGFKGKEFYWHSDFETWHVEDGMPRMRAISISLLLMPNNPNNGPLMLIPGSHRQFVSCAGDTPDNNYLTSLKKQEYGVPDEKILTELAHKHGIAAPTGEPGTVVIFDCNTMHGSNGNITPFPRANTFMVFNAVSNRLGDPFCAKAPRPEFVATRDVKPIRSPELTLT